MTIIEELTKLEAQKELLDKLLEEYGYECLVLTLQEINLRIEELQEKATKTVEEIELSFVAAFDLETQTEEAHRKLEVRKQSDDTFRFTITSTFKDGVEVQNQLHIGKNAFFLFYNGFYKAKTYFKFTNEDVESYMRSQGHCIEYKFEEKPNPKEV